MGNGKERHSNKDEMVEKWCERELTQNRMERMKTWLSYSIHKNEPFTTMDHWNSRFRLKFYIHNHTYKCYHMVILMLSLSFYANEWIHSVLIWESALLCLNGHCCLAVQLAQQFIWQHEKNFNIKRLLDFNCRSLKHSIQFRKLLFY